MFGTKRFILLFFFIVLGFCFKSGLVSAEDELPLKSWKIPFDINERDKLPPNSKPPEIKGQSDIYNFMWQSFVALNWPWDSAHETKGKSKKWAPQRGKPDVHGHLAPWNTGEESEGPVVWETYRPPNEVFIAPELWPIHWNDPAPQQLCNTDGDLQDIRVVSSSSTNYSNNADALNQPYLQAGYSTGPVLDQNGEFLRYEVGLNQSYFTYISHFRYYNPYRQIKSVKNYIEFVKAKNKKPPTSNKRDARYFQPLPNGTERYLTRKLEEYALQGIVEWKAAWKVLGDDDNLDRFYWRYINFANPDGTCTGPVKAGVVALHIHRVTPYGHIGTTFEQVDNTNLQPEYSSEKVSGAADLPLHASLNPEGRVAPEYDNGYQICDADGKDCKAGIGGTLPEPVKKGEPFSTLYGITNISRQVAIPEDVRKINTKWRKRLKGTVLFYYQMIDTQNKNLNIEPNPHLGPGTLGAQVSNTRNLINTALESYTQEGWSCALCHQNAFPLGVDLPFPPTEENYAALRTISFLLQNAAQFKNKHKH